MVAPRKFNAVICRKSVNFPATSTDQPAAVYTFFDFLAEWVIQSAGMRRDENLDHRFEWEDTLESFRERMAAKGNTFQPVPPMFTGDATHDKEAADAFNRQAADYRDKVSKASEGEAFYISEAAFKAGLDAAREAIHAACDRGPMGQPRTLHLAYEPKILRFYHATRQSKPILESEIPPEITTDTAALPS